ncbi:uncharacterized protein [Epargyreus clarus]|uniref:uncharacterized protein isoform X2 n=1 Tax=Epargyreus clarus TaxID=520877 RepID=UPI003C2CC9EA
MLFYYKYHLFLYLTNMPILNKLPEVSKCCGCINDLKTAAAIIAVLGIVTSPALSWAVVRHAYVIRVSCFVTTSSTRPDVVDINLRNVLSFGFGANAGLGPSCLIKNTTKADLREAEDDTDDSPLVDVIRYFGWVVLIVDVVFLVISINFLVKMSKGADKSASKSFMIAAFISVFLSFVYGMLYVGTCLYVGGSFPIFEFFFALFDLIMWIYFLIVVNSYRRKAP